MREPNARFDAKVEGAHIFGIIMNVAVKFNFVKLCTGKSVLFWMNRPFGNALFRWGFYYFANIGTQTSGWSISFWGYFRVPFYSSIDVTRHKTNIRVPRDVKTTTTTTKNTVKAEFINVSYSLFLPELKHFYDKMYTSETNVDVWSGYSKMGKQKYFDSTMPMDL